MDLASKQYFIFDLDDTLINTYEANEVGLRWAYEKLTSEFIGTLSKTLSFPEYKTELTAIYKSKTASGKRRHYDYDERIFEKYCTKELPKKESMLGGEALIHTDHSLAVRLYWQFRDMKDAALMPKPHAQNILFKISQEGDNYCITQGRCNYQHRKLMLTNLEEYFAGIHIAQKDKTKELDEYIKKKEMERDRCVMIGDTDTDIKAAKNAGIDSILIPSKGHPTKSKPTMTISSLRVLDRLLDKWLNGTLPDNLS